MDTPNPCYEERLRIVAILGEKVPGTFRSRKDMGLFAGIHIQTRWQLVSGRDSIPEWHLLNEMLTAAPYAYYSGFERGEAIGYVEGDESLRQMWVDYFIGCGKLATLKTRGTFFSWVQASLYAHFMLTYLLWRAHTGSMRFALSRHNTIFKTSRLAQEERAFWSNWTRFVLLGRFFPVPTTAGIVGPILTCTMPSSSPVSRHTIREESFLSLRKYFLIAFTRSLPFVS